MLAKAVPTKMCQQKPQRTTKCPISSADQDRWRDVASKRAQSCFRCPRNSATVITGTSACGISSRSLSPDTMASALLSVASAAR